MHLSNATRADADQILNGNGRPIEGASLLANGTLVDSQVRPLTLDAAGNAIAVSPSGQPLDLQGDPIPGASIVNGTTVDALGNPLALDANGRPVTINPESGVPLDALGNPIAGSSFSPIGQVRPASIHEWRFQCLHHAAMYVHARVTIARLWPTTLRTKHSVVRCAYVLQF